MVTIKRILAILSDREWINYFRYEWRVNRFVAMFFPVKLGFSVVSRCLSVFSNRMQKPAGVKGENADALAPIVLSSRPRPKPVFLFSDEDIMELTEYAHKNLSHDVQEIISSANKILKGIFPVLNLDFDLKKSNNWRGPFSDPEELFYLNRWYHGIILAKASVYTGREEYAENFTVLLQDWADKNPVDSSSPVWESYSVGERISNWLFAHHLLKRSSYYNQHGSQLTARLLSEHSEYLRTHLEEKVVHNHLINNARALFLYGLLCPDLPMAAQLHREGWNILTREMGRQFSDDGVLAEQSTHYHFLLLNRYAEVFLLAQRNGYVLPDPLKQKLVKMFEVANLFVRPDQTLALIGDVSPDIDPKMVLGVLALGAAFFGVQSPVFPSEHALWFLGREGVRKWSSGPAQTGLYHLKDSGYLIYKTTYIHLIIHAEPKVDRHGHHDILSPDLWFSGDHLLADSGNSSFNSDMWHRYFKGPYSHSTIVINGLPPFLQSAAIRSLLPQKYSNAKSGFERLEIDDNRIFIKCWHDGYRRLPDPLMVWRSIEVFGTESMTITDQLDGSGEYNVEILFQFGQNEIRMGRDLQTILVYGPDGVKCVEVKFQSNHKLGIDLLCGTVTPKMAGWLSMRYGERVEATTAVCRFGTKGPAFVKTSFYFLDGSHRASFPEG